MTLPTGIVATAYTDGRTLYRLGTCFAGTPPFNAPAYSVGAINVPFHGWFQQWTDRPNPPTIKRTPAQLAAANRAFSYGPVPGCTTFPVTQVSYAGPMDNAGIYKAMIATGERPDIGLVTDWTAQWLLGGSPSSMLAQAIAADSIPINFVDETTGKPVDKVSKPQANTYDTPNGQGQPWFPRGPKDTASGYYLSASGWKPDASHYPSLSYMAFEATADVGFLYNLQHAGQMAMIFDASSCNSTRAVISPSSNPRQIAWGFRSLFEAHTATLDAEALAILPPDLHPSSYWKKLLDNNLAFYLPQISDPKRQTLRQFGKLEPFDPWQYDYLLSALSFGILTGHSDWLPIYLWCFDSVIERTKGGSYLQNCYPTGWGVAYEMLAFEWLKKSDGTYDKTKYDYTKPLNWWTSFLFMQNMTNSTPPTPAQISALQTDPLNGGVAMVGNIYLMTSRAILVMADTLEKKGLASVRAQYPQLDTCLANVNAMIKAYGKMNARQSVISPTSTQPPAGGISVSKPVSVQVGQHIAVPFTYDDGAGHPSKPPTAMAAVSVPAGLVNATVTVNTDGTGTIDVVGMVASGPGAILQLSGQGATALVSTAPLSVSVPLPEAGALYLNP